MVLASAEDWDHLSTGHYEELGTQALINASESVRESENEPIAIIMRNEMSSSSGYERKEVNDYNYLPGSTYYLLLLCSVVSESITIPQSPNGFILTSSSSLLE